MEAGHHTGAAGFGEGGKPLVQVIACLTDVWEQIFDNVEDFEGDAAGEGSAAEGGAVLAFGEGSGGGVVEEGCAEGESGGERFGGDGDVGEEVGEALVGEEVAGAAESALGFIGDEEGVGGGGEAAGFAEEGSVTAAWRAGRWLAGCWRVPWARAALRAASMASVPLLEKKAWERPLHWQRRWSSGAWYSWL